MPCIRLLVIEAKHKQLMVGNVKSYDVWNWMLILLITALTFKRNVICLLQMLIVILLGHNVTVNFKIAVQDHIMLKLGSISISPSRSKFHWTLSVPKV
jgi:hypothetical protein